MRSKLLLSLVLVVFGVLTGYGQTTYLMAGSYTDGKEAEGIYVYEFNSLTGELAEVDRVGAVVNPSFLTLSQDGQYLYACTDTKLKSHGSVSAFKIDTLSGQLTFINKQTTGARNPVHVITDRNNDYVISANYSESSLTVFRPKDDGSLPPYAQLMTFSGQSIVSGRQDASHMHSATVSPDNQYLFAPDLGTDQLRGFTFSERGGLEEVDNLTIDTKKGNGPRHFTFSPDGRFAYCVDELSGTVSSYRYKRGKLKWIDADPTQENIASDYASADIHISPDGKFLYASNRAALNNISIFEIDQTRGKLSLIKTQSGGGEHPRSFVIDPTGQFLIVANQISGTIVVFRRNNETGLLTQTVKVIQVDSPSSLKMVTYQD